MSELRIYSSEIKELGASDLPPIINTEDDKDKEKRDTLFKFINRLIDAENLIVLAGSGTSLTFNRTGQPKIAPSMADLWEACKSLNENLFGEVLGIVRYSAVAETWPDGAQKEDIELLLSLCDTYASLKILGEEEQGKIDTFLKASKRKILDETRFTEKVTKDEWRTHNKFISALGHRSPKQKRLKIFTTNYDLAFEVAASNTGLIIIDGFEFGSPYRFNPAWYHYDIVNRTQASEKGGAYIPNVIHLYKIHGSVDWIRANDGIYKIDKLAGKEGEPVFIYPSNTKYQSSYEPPYLDMMAAFLESVQKPKTALLCIGFGFNDKHINNAITMALRTNPEFMLMAATKAPFDKGGSFNSEVRERLMSSVEAGDSRIALVDCTFDVLVDLLPNRHKESPEERLIKLFDQVLSKGDGE